MDYIYKVNFKVLQIHTSCFGTSGFFTWNLTQLAIDELLDYVGRMRAIGIQSRKAGDRKGWWLKQEVAHPKRFYVMCNDCGTQIYGVSAYFFYCCWVRLLT